VRNLSTSFHQCLPLLHMTALLPKFFYFNLNKPRGERCRVSTRYKLLNEYWIGKWFWAARNEADGKINLIRDQLEVTSPVLVRGSKSKRWVLWWGDGDH
jgi:hypothetical protein